MNRIWHPWLRINRVLRVMLQTRWDAEAWSVVRVEFRKALALLVCVVACASPAAKTRDTPIAIEEPPPRFATGGPDAEEFGASMGYPKGNPATFRSTRSLVGSFSHLDEIFRGRLIHKAPRPSRLVRVAEPRITWTFRGAELTLDDYLSRNPTTPSASPHGRWPRP